MRIVDLTDPHAPAAVAVIDTRGPARDVVVRDGTAFVVETDGVEHLVRGERTAE